MDKGYNNFITDLKDLLTEAEAFEFHDFKNEKYEAPKIKLVERLNAIRDGVINGDYDN